MEIRSQEFARNDRLEAFLQQLNRLLSAAEVAAHLPDEPTEPTVLIVGPPRSGTTLLLQWLAASGQLGYPSNLLSRFYGSPFVGATIQRLLTDPTLAYRKDLLVEQNPSTRFTSDLGSTIGLLNVNSFWYFWRRFIPLDVSRRLLPHEYARVDLSGMLHGLSALETGLGRPLVAKALLFQYDLSLVLDALPRSIVIYLRRSPEANAASLLEARIRHTGSRDRWYSTRPPGSQLLEDAAPEIQVCGQILATHRALEEQLAEVDHRRVLKVDLAEFLTEPHGVWRRLQQAFVAVGSGLGPHSEPNVAFSPDRRAQQRDTGHLTRAFATARNLLDGASEWFPT